MAELLSLSVFQNGSVLCSSTDFTFLLLCSPTEGIPRPIPVSLLTAIYSVFGLCFSQLWRWFWVSLCHWLSTAPCILLPFYIPLPTALYHRSWFNLIVTEKVSDVSNPSSSYNVAAIWLVPIHFPVKIPSGYSVFLNFLNTTGLTMTYHTVFGVLHCLFLDS